MKTLLVISIIFLLSLSVKAKIIYLEPVMDAKFVNTENNIIIGFDDFILSTKLNFKFIVKGSVSGIHSGEIIFSSDKKKIIFKPDQPFALNEKVEVKMNNLRTSLTKNNSLKYSFQTQSGKIESSNSIGEEDESENPPFNNLIQPRNPFSMPPITVNVSVNPSPGHILLNSYNSGIYTSYLISANNDGSTYYSRQMSGNAADFIRQQNGLLTYFDFTKSKYYAEDSQHNRVDSFYTGNGFVTDGHDLKLLNNGHAILMSYNKEFVDMSVIVPGGDTNAVVTGLIIQEIDENKNVVFQWRSWDHFNIIDAIYVNHTSHEIDPVHGNALDSDNDGNILISSRHLNEITKINSTTGDIIWRLGGVNNQFTFTNDTVPFHYQHNIRRISNGNITLFDNGNFRSPLYSRALEYQLDEVNKIATLVWQYINSPVIYSANRGSVQRLINGNTLIGWGGTNPTVTEVTPAGTIALEMTYPAGQYSYRAFRDEVNFTLNAKIAIEGLYNNFTDQLNMKDIVTAYVRNSFSPFSIVDSAKSTVDIVNFTGNFRFFNVADGTYYFSIKHRNGLETWSKVGGESFTAENVYEYDFTSSASNSYGSNITLKGSKYCFYSGDINQDETIDINDLSYIENDASNSLSGYVSSDLTGDDFVDGSDMSIVENNAALGVNVVSP